MDRKEIEAEAMKLDPSSRARLAEKLLRSLEEIDEAESNGAIWAEEAGRRERGLGPDRHARRSRRPARRPLEAAVEDAGLDPPARMLRRFPYGILYRARAGRIRVLAIMHLHRRPTYRIDRD